MPHSFSYAVSMNLEHSIKEGSHERYPDHFQCFRNIKKIKYPDFQAMTITNGDAVPGLYSHITQSQDQDSDSIPKPFKSTKGKGGKKSRRGKSKPQ